MQREAGDYPIFFHLSAFDSISRPRAAAGVSSDVTGGRPVLTSAAVGGGAPGPPQAGTGRGRLPPHRSCARSDQAGRLGLRPIGAYAPEGTKEETPSAAPFRKAKVKFQIFSVPLAHIRRHLASNPICFGGTPEREPRSFPIFSGLVQEEFRVEGEVRPTRLKLQDPPASPCPSAIGFASCDCREGSHGGRGAGQAAKQREKMRDALSVNTVSICASP
jgi:hypothetical protein